MSTTRATPGRERAAITVFWLCSVLLALGYGVVAGMFDLFPRGWFERAFAGWSELQGDGDGGEHWYYKKARAPYPPPIANSGRAQPGVNLVTEIGKDELVVKVMDLDGKDLHRWSIDWFTIWPDATHVPERLRPRSRPGTHVNGAALLDDGDLVCSFEHLGLLRLDRGGRPVWRLPYQTHHSVVRGDDGNLWVCGQKEHAAPLPGFPDLVPPFVEDTILVVTPAGAIVREWSVLQLLRDNGRQGLLTLASRDDFSTAVSGDITHLNHVEPFPSRLPAAVFGPGDVLVSLRNISTVFVFDSRTAKIEFACTGPFTRQHDPHFVDGRTLSVFDNRHLAPGDVRPQSRIVFVSAPEQTVTEYFAGTPEHPFFTPILGRHQWLPDGHLLVTDSCAGRAFELDRDRQVVWWYVNYVDEGIVGAVEQVQRLPHGNMFQRR